MANDLIEFIRKEDIKKEHGDKMYLLIDTDLNQNKQEQKNEVLEKISEVSKSVQSKVKYNLESMLGITANSVNVCVQGVRSLDD